MATLLELDLPIDSAVDLYELIGIAKIRATEESRGRNWALKPYGCRLPCFEEGVLLPLRAVSVAA
ncbi:MAG: hypothetical protein QNL12_00890 [Acidimicrobiia bacterium]|nr:hypothetical protein [Acidimicrobiia bacterium]MDX2465841.1 hypothetical protein [Acidimicrobiia bacterium]